MKKLLILALSIVLSVVFVASAQARPEDGVTTINLRSCIDSGDGACLTQGDQVLGQVRICLQWPGGGEPECITTEEIEEGEHWWDSQPHGRYSAYVQGVPADYELVGATCTTHPADPYKPCKVRGNEVYFVVKKGTNAVNINFLFSPIDD
ncbi:MAG TPA: hypothetical protein VEZ12_15295 [Herpetosiphonaceae bacterium]|nr:hypothetical protein [Herpetosiphonaceae bacterium]